MSAATARLSAAATAQAGEAMHAFATRLYPIPRSLTGDGVRATLREIQNELGAAAKLAMHEVPTGTPVLDWTVPREWNLREASIRGPHGEVVADSRANNLHVVGYSTALRARVDRETLRAHLHSLPERPDWIPYRTSYYKETWGFCLPHRVAQGLPEGEYEVSIDATLADGHLSFGEVFLAGDSEDEVLVSCHVCHPQLANDNLSGIAVATHLIRHLSGTQRRHSYRFLFVPGTIGPLVWLALNRDRTERIRHGLVLANLGDAGGFHYKRSRRGDSEIDRAVPAALRDLGEACVVEEFTPYGYDERQYGSPGFDLPVGCFSRTPWGRYPEYHTSADNLEFLKAPALGGALRAAVEICGILEANRRYRNLQPHGEPQLGRRGLYGTLGGGGAKQREMALLWVLNQSDGEHDLLAIAERSKLPFAALAQAAQDLVAAGLLAPIVESTGP